MEIPPLAAGAPFARRTQQLLFRVSATLLGLPPGPAIHALGFHRYATLTIHAHYRRPDAANIMLGIQVEFPQKYYNVILAGNTGAINHKAYGPDRLVLKRPFRLSFASPETICWVTLGQHRSAVGYVRDGSLFVALQISDTSVEANAYDQINKMFEMVDAQFGGLASELNRIKAERDDLTAALAALEGTQVSLEAEYAALEAECAALRAERDEITAQRAAVPAALEGLRAVAVAAVDALEARGRRPHTEPAAPSLETRIAAAVRARATAELAAIQAELAGHLSRVATALVDARACAICLDAEADTTLLPCRHRCVCASCFGQLPAPKTCPLCKAGVDQGLVSYG